MLARDTMTTEPFPREGAEDLPMRVFRHIGAAYETGDANCWEAAHARAEGALGPDAGALLVARVTAMLRLIRTERPDFRLLPSPCRALSRDEAALLGLLRAARRSRSPLAAAGRILGDLAAAARLAGAARAVSGVSWGQPRSVLLFQSEINAVRQS